MNKERRKRIQTVINQIEEIRSDLDLITEEERDYMFNIPENLQNSERYEKAEETVDNLGNAGEELEEVIGLLETVIE